MHDFCEGSTKVLLLAKTYLIYNNCLLFFYICSFYFVVGELLMVMLRLMLVVDGLHVCNFNVVCGL